MNPGLEARMTAARGEFALEAEITIAAGETLALLGPNGAGKSTAAEAVAGLLALQRGSITLGGRVLDDPERGILVAPERRRIGVVFQDLALFPHLDVLENTAFGLRAQGASRMAARRLAGERLEEMGLGELADRRPRELSGGQAQRAALARALAARPEMLILDEPLAALDVTARAETRRLLASYLAEFPGPRLVITHDPAEAFLLSDRVAILEEGKISQEGLPDQIRLRPRTKYAADLAGVNLLVGRVANGVLQVGGFQLAVPDGVRGPAAAVVHPRAISLHVAQPAGSPRNVWRTVIERIERYGDVARVRTGEPLPLTAEVTAGALSSLAVEEGSPVWMSLKATEITLQAR